MTYTQEIKALALSYHDNLTESTRDNGERYIHWRDRGFKNCVYLAFEAHKTGDGPWDFDMPSDFTYKVILQELRRIGLTSRPPSYCGTELNIHNRILNFLQKEVS